jgi:hypothetical protein
MWLYPGDHPTRVRVDTACEKDDTLLISRIIAKVTEQDKHQVLLQYTIKQSIECNSASILKLILERGGRVEELWTTDIVGRHKRRTSIPILEDLLHHGWNINYRGPHWDPMPFMWHIVEHGDMVTWCLEHGASVVIVKNGHAYHHGACPEILEKAIQYATVVTFELLRSKGAPLGWRPLHLAVQEAVQDSRKIGADGDGNDEKINEDRARLTRRYLGRMAMVRHLVDAVGVDVNALDRPDGRRTQDYIAGNPLCYVASYDGYGYEFDIRELVWFLLNRGADPTFALEMAETPTFGQEVQAWKDMQRNYIRSSWSKHVLRYWPS